MRRREQRCLRVRKIEDHHHQAEPEMNGLTGDRDHGMMIAMCRPPSKPQLRDPPNSRCSELGICGRSSDSATHLHDAPLPIITADMNAHGCADGRDIGPSSVRLWDSIPRSICGPDLSTMKVPSI